MNFILTGLLLGSIVTSQHKDREECEGRAVMLREKGVSAVQCTNHSSNSLSFTGTTSSIPLCLTPSGSSSYGCPVIQR